MSITVYVGLFIIGCFAFAVLWIEGLLKKRTVLIASIFILAAAMLLRGICMDYETLDYQAFLERWVDFFRQYGGFKALSQNVGNYNVPYLYFLAIFSYSGVSDLYLIKFLSVFFDVILAWGVMRTVYYFKGSETRVLASFFITLFLPTVVLNGALWGQCDSIYAAFAVWSIYFALCERPLPAMIFAALSFAFKLQAVFFLPVFLVFIFAKKLKWWQLVFFPLTYLVVILPAIALGRPLWDTVTLYFNQTGSIGSGLNYNSPSVFAIFRNVQNSELASKLAIAAAFLFLLIVFSYLFGLRKKISDRSLLACTLLFTVAIPFILPHMHDRYFFLADIFSLVFAVVVPAAAPLPVLVSFASLLGYHAYLKMKFFLPMRYGSAALILVIVSLLIYLFLNLSKKRKKRC